MNTQGNKNFNLMKFISHNSVPMLFIFLCLGGFAASGQSAVFVFNEIVVRLARNLFLVLALIIPVIAGMGLNFAIVIGAMAGQIGLIFIKVADIGGIGGFLVATLVAIPFALLFGIGTGKILNKTKGKEMITSLILGFFANGLYQLVFLLFMGTLIPVKNPEIILSSGIGLKNALDLKFMQYAIDNIVKIRFMGIVIPVVPLILIVVLCIFIIFIVKTKLGQDFRALGQDLHVAKIAGINTDKVRIIAMCISTLLAAWGQIIFIQNIGTLNTYVSHENVGMFAIAALLIGGASVTKASISNAIIGTILFHTLFIVSPNAGKNLFGDAQLGEYFRQFISYGVIAMSLVLHAWQKHMSAKDRLQ
ncbi:MAG: ABC transporter permease subunit [Bacillota bacterium]